MTDADTAYAAAKKAIAEAKASGAHGLNLSGWVGNGIYKALDRLPPEIADLKDLISLFLGRTQISHIAALQGMNRLTELFLHGTQISDISALQGMTRLTALDLQSTQISDIAVLQGMTRLTRLGLSGTQISDISALQGMTGLTDLSLSSTRISDISALQGMTKLTELSLSSTQISDISVLKAITGLTDLELSFTPINDAVLPLLATLQNLSHLNLSSTSVLDLRPLRALALLTSAPGDNPWQGFHFEDTAATRLDTRIAEIAEIENNAERARVLFDYLKDWVPPPRPTQPTDGPTQPIPPRRPAPLEVAVSDDRISRVGPGPLPLADAQDRARRGWEALNRHRADFGEAFNIHNYPLLSKTLAAFDREMGDRFDVENVIAIGHQGLRLQALSRNAAYCIQLPEGCPEDFAVFVEAVMVYVRRFPDWVAYLNDPDPAEDAEMVVSGAHAEFEALNDALAGQDGVDAEVAQAYDHLFQEAVAEGAGPIEAKGLVRSTEETVRAIAEYEVERKAKQRHNRRMARAGGDFVDDLTKPFGVPHYLALHFEAPFRRLHQRYPKRFGFIIAWYDETFGSDDEHQDPNR